MADDVQIELHSKEKIALDLAKIISAKEGKSFMTPGTSFDRKYALDLYAECLVAVMKPSARIKD